MSEAMKRIITDDELRKNLKNKGIDRAKLFSWQICAAETLKEIENLSKSVK